MSGKLRPYYPEGGPPGSRVAHEAAQARVQRGIRAIVVRMRRAGVTFVLLFVTLMVYMLGFATPGLFTIFTFPLALFAIFLLSLTTLALPVRDRGRRRREESWNDPRPVIDGGAAVRLERLTARTEEWLLARSYALPSQAGPALDRIVFRLRDLQPTLEGVKPETPIGGEARRLIGEHLPDLVTTYLELPAGDRNFQAESSARLAESLGIVADQMDDLSERVRTERLMGFEAERRFIETRYKDGDRLSLDR